MVKRVLKGTDVDTQELVERLHELANSIQSGETPITEATESHKVVASGPSEVMLSLTFYVPEDFPRTFLTYDSVHDSEAEIDTE